MQLEVQVTLTIGKQGSPLDFLTCLQGKVLKQELRHFLLQSHCPIHCSL